MCLGTRPWHTYVIVLPLGGSFTWYYIPLYIPLLGISEREIIILPLSRVIHQHAYANLISITPHSLAPGQPPPPPSFCRLVIHDQRQSEKHNSSLSHTYNPFFYLSLSFSTFDSHAPYIQLTGVRSTGFCNYFITFLYCSYDILLNKIKRIIVAFYVCNDTRQVICCWCLFILIPRRCCSNYSREQVINGGKICNEALTFHKIL